MNFLHHKNCIVCENKEFELLLTKENYKYIKCENCGLIFVNPTPILTKEEMDKLNENEWLPTLRTFRDFRDSLKNFYSHPEYERQFYAFYKYVKKGKILDIGCGTGYFLYSAKKMGFEPFGIDVCEVAIKYIKNMFGIDGFCGELKEAKLPSDYFDGIRCAHVLEHVVNPIQTLKEINRIIKKGGILQIGVPNEDAFCHILRNLYHKIRKKYKKEKYSCCVFPPVHFYGFTKKSIKILLKKTNFNILRCFTTGRGDRIYAPFVFNTSLKTIIEEVIDLFGSTWGRGSLLYIYAQK